MIKKAFTMVEVIITIVLLGIIAGIGAEIISKAYMNYIQSRTINYLQSQSDIVVEQIAKRLQYRIKDTAIARRTVDGAIDVLNSPAVGPNHNVIEWIGYSNEAMLGSPPGWSGFIDLYSAATSGAAGTLDTPGSNLNTATGTITALNYGAGPNLALVFKAKPTGYYDPQNDPGYGWRIAGVTDINYLVPVATNGNTAFSIVGANRPTRIYEHYYLAHTAYAIHRDANRDGSNSNDDFALMLSYNYQPWRGGTFNNPNTQRVILAENVNLFRIQQVGNTIRIKLCLHDGERSGAGRKLVACKEEVIF